MTPAQMVRHRTRLVDADILCRQAMARFSDLLAAVVRGTRLDRAEERAQAALDRFNELEATYPGHYLGTGSDSANRYR